MKIEWKGHACFLLTTENGTRILTDPFNERVGYPVPHVSADYVTVSHSHYDHNAVHVLDTAHNTPVVIQERGEHPFPELIIRGFASFHDKEQGTKRGPNTIYAIETEGLRLVHLGDLGHLLTPKLVQAIGKVDILCIPVGGFYTIDASEAKHVIEQLQPSIVFPMHYNLAPYVKLPIEPLNAFEKLYPSLQVLAELHVTPESLPKSLQVTALQPKLS